MGIVPAALGVRFFRAIAPAGTPRLSEIAPDATLFWFALASSLVAGILFGLAPARRASAHNPNDALKGGIGGGVSGSSSVRQPKLGNALVVAEVALAFVLLTGSVLLTKSLGRLLSQDTGMRTDQVLSFDLPKPPGSRGNSSKADVDANVQEQIAQVKEVVARVQSVPGVESVSVTDHGVLGGSIFMQYGLEVEGALPAVSKIQSVSQSRYIGPGYFHLLGVDMLRGREFSESDTRGSQKVVVVNEAMARRYWGTLDVLGKRIGLDDFFAKDPVNWMSVVGVVRNARDVQPGSAPAPEYFMPLYQSDVESHHLLVRTAGDPAAMANTLKRAIWSSFPDQPVTQMATLAETIRASVGDQRMHAVLLSLFAGLGLALALIGIYGVMAYSVARRTREIGIRMALGARQANVMRMVLGQGLLLGGIGVAIGAGAAVGL
ncbi:MAG: ABC transporter permease, partial [Bryobacteraceae bacterium]